MTESKNNLNVNDMPELKLSVGSDHFKDLISSDLFVDKSLFIKEVIDAADKAMLITRPRRWGKTLNMQMLKYFFSPEVDENGVIKSTNSNRTLFEGSIADDGDKTRPFKKLKIAKENEGAYMLHQGKWPVICLTFKNIKGQDYSEIEAKIIDVISDVFKSHEYLYSAISSQQNISIANQANLAQFKRIVDKTPAQGELESSLQFLSQLLYNHFNKNVYILVDEYDKTFNALLEDDINNQEQHDLRIKVANLITNIFSACGKSNNYLEKMVLTGIFDTLKKEGNSGFNNVSIYGILDADFSSSFGFSEEEINKQLLSKFNLDTHTEKEIRVNIKNWYNGYSVPTYRNGNIQVYTPWAVMKYLNKVYKGNAEPESYWTKSGSSTILRNLLAVGVEESLKDRFIAFAQGEKQELDFDKGISLFNCNLDHYKNVEKVFSYLLINSGYLTAEQQGRKYICYVPNFEIKQEFADCVDAELNTWRMFRISDPFVEALIKVDESGIRDNLLTYVFETFSNIDAPKSEAGNKGFTSEKSYHMFILGLLQKMRKTHIISSEPESGFGRSDIIVLPRPIDASITKRSGIKNAEGTGFIIELKRMNADTQQTSKLQTLAKQGLEQIKSQKYRAMLDKHECKNQVFMSVAFYGKEVAIVLEQHLSTTFNADNEWKYATAKMSEYTW